MGTIKFILTKNSYEHVTHGHVRYRYAARLYLSFIVFGLSNSLLKKLYLRFLYAQFKKTKILC